MKKIKKSVAILLAVVSLVVLSACYVDYYPEYESGYYKYAVKTEKDGTKKAYILGLTDLGLEQTTLIYPDEIDGIPVYGIGYGKPVPMGHDPVGAFYSTKLEKFYFPEMPKERARGNIGISFNNGYEVYWNLVLGNNWLHGNSKGAVWGYNYYLSYIKDRPILNNRNFIANVSYLYNYENAPNENYYWVDSYDESLITFIPPNPERDGYIFNGWYKETECISEWDFSTDITGKSIKDLDRVRYETYEGIYLYAKWIAE